MFYFHHPNIVVERHFVENGKRILEGFTTVVLNCNDRRFSKFARDSVESEKTRVARRWSFDEVRLSPI